MGFVRLAPMGIYGCARFFPGRAAISVSHTALLSILWFSIAPSWHTSARDSVACQRGVERSARACGDCEKKIVFVKPILRQIESFSHESDFLIQIMVRGRVMQLWFRITILSLVSAFALSCSTETTEKISVREASGITRVGNMLLIVGDDADGKYFELGLPKRVGEIIPVDPAKVVEVLLKGAELAMDLEGVDALGDGRLVFLSEQLRCLIGKATPQSDSYSVIAEYDRTLTEFGHRGLEGLAVKRLEGGHSRVAVLWEGGYPEYADIPIQFRDRVGGLPLKPVIVVHDIGHGEVAGVVRAPAARILLNVPEPEGDPPYAQRFRATDLVWHRKDGDDAADEFIVLLSSSNSPPDELTHSTQYKLKTLQRFNFDGEPVGEPIDMKNIFSSALARENSEAYTITDDDMFSHLQEISSLLQAHDWENVNWEGLGWFVEGESLIAIYDGVPKDPPFALIIEIPQDWK